MLNQHNDKSNNWRYMKVVFLENARYFKTVSKYVVYILNNWALAWVKGFWMAWTSDGTVRGWGHNTLLQVQPPSTTPSITTHTLSTAVPCLQEPLLSTKTPTLIKNKTQNPWFLWLAWPLAANKYSDKNRGEGGKPAQWIRGALLLLQRNWVWAQYPE